MKSIIALFVLGLFCAAMTGCETRDKTYEKKTTVKYDSGGGTVQTTTVEKK